MRLHPRHRGDCADFFAAPQQNESIDLDASVSTISELEHAAARAGRTWNDQLCYVVELVLGDHAPDFEDERSVEEWRSLLSPCRLRTSETGGWVPFTCLWGKTL